MSKYLKLACEYLGISEAQVLKPKEDEDAITLLVDRGIAGIPKYILTYAELDEFAAKQEPPKLVSGPLSGHIWPLANDKPEPPLAKIDATDGALRLIEENHIDPADVLAFLGEDKRLNVKDVRAYLREQKAERS